MCFELIVFFTEKFKQKRFSFIIIGQWAQKLNPGSLVEDRRDHPLPHTPHDCLGASFEKQSLVLQEQKHPQLTETTLA